MRSFPRVLAVCVLGLVVSSTTSGLLRAKEPDPQVVFDHLDDNCDKSFRVTLSDGEQLTILIKNTAPNLFRYEVAGVEFAPDLAAQVRADARTGLIDPKKLVPKKLSQLHQKKYGGYIVRIRNVEPTKPVEVTPEKEGDPPRSLKDVTLFIIVETSGWDYELAGAFTVSGLTDPVYALKTREVNGKSEQFIVEDKEARDDARLGLGAFVNVFCHDWPHLAPSFGLGVNQDNKTTYYVGGSLRLGGRASVTGGIAFGSVARLPNGLSVGPVNADANALNNLSSRVGHSWFFSFSYSFIQVGELIQKPFKGAEEKEKEGSTTKENDKQVPSTPATIEQ